MTRARKHLIVSILLLLIGIFFVFSSITDITGASIGITSPLSSLGNMVLGLCFIGASFIIFMAGESELEKKIKSYRRHLEREEHKKISYEEAKIKYERAERKYWGDVGKGIIKREDAKRPLQFMVDYSESEKEKENNFALRQFTSSYMHDPTARRLAEDALENQRVKKDVKNILELYRKGHNRPGLMPVRIEGTDGVREFRSKKGARIYWRGNIDKIDIVGLGNKGNSEKVIEYLKK
ncbi:hypothetical protein HYS50_02680, partial [Candidatus Woesearchaeota archaeon]|nr:hypothetical protein [Candidatus Woesearchaeota archaeon]